MLITIDRPIAASIIPAAICAVGLWLTIGFLEGFSQASIGLIPLVVPAAWFLLVAASLYFGQRRGLGTLWALMLVLSAAQIWFAYPIDAFISRADHPFLARGLGMTNAFWGWSAVALPLFVATWVILFRAARPSRLWFGCVGIGWLVLLLIARPLAGVAWDVYPPRYPPTAVASFGLLVLAPAPILLSSYFVRQLWRRAV